MMTLRQFVSGLKEVPAATSWYLADLGEARGRQDLFTRQAPQRLKVLCQNALIESAVSSNRMEGVVVDQDRVRPVLLGKAPLQDREVGRYISLERVIEQNKERYYETLEQSSQGWHQKHHDPWPYIHFILSFLKEAYGEFEERAGQIKSPRGAKTELIESALHSFRGDFTLFDLEKACPGVSRDMIRKVLRTLKKARKVKCLGRGPGALWRRKGTVLKRG